MDWPIGLWIGFGDAGESEGEIGGGGCGGICELFGCWGASNLKAGGLGWGGVGWFGDACIMYVYVFLPGGAQHPITSPR